jgi:hypothetical protein
MPLVSIAFVKMGSALRAPSGKAVIGRAASYAGVRQDSLTI